VSREVRTRLVTLGVLALVFGLGVLVGVVADRTVGDGWDRASTDDAAEATDSEADSAAQDADEAPESRSRWLIHQVDLSDPQRVFVDSVISFYRAEVRSLSESYDAAYWEAVQATREALRGVLDPLQRARYDELLEERDRARGREDAGRDR
jgi:hypothetical protein